MRRKRSGRMSASTLDEPAARAQVADMATQFRRLPETSADSLATEIRSYAEALLMVAAMKLVLTGPGVFTPVRSSGRPFGSLSENVTVIVPSLPISADWILVTRPGRTNAKTLGSA